MSQFSRRSALGLFAGAAALTALPTAFAEGVAGRKFIFVLLRGAMDGLSALIPDDAALSALRPNSLPAPSERLNLGNGFRLHPSLSGLQTLYQAGEASFIPAAATSYRNRSHFDGQDFLESLAVPTASDGWLNRALQNTGGRGLAVGYALPLAMQGSAPASNWSPPVFDEAPEDLLNRLNRLYANDTALQDTLQMARMSAMDLPEMGMTSSGRGQQISAQFEAIGSLMAAENGPGVGMVSIDGWDTHANQRGPLGSRLQQLDAGLTALKTVLGDHWATSCVVLCSEFGRTAAENGTRGTDHGTGGLVMLVGGAVRGGQVHGDWPGLASRNLFEGRDVAPANSVEAVLKGVLRDHLGVNRRALDANVLPGTGAAVEGLVGV